MLRNKKTLIALSLIPQYFLIKVLSNFPELIEQYYSLGVYPFISKIFRFNLGWLPFSFGDLIYFFTPIYIIQWGYKNRKRIIKDSKNWLIDVTAAFAIIYFAFHFFWGLNYYRQPLHENLNLKANYSTDQLVLVTKKLIETSNAIHLKITKNDTIKVVIPYTKNSILNSAPLGYKNLKKTFPDLKYHPESIKNSLFSYPLTYMGFSGYLNPLTNEAHIDYLIPIYKFPTTITHEIAHQLGYAAENEANFIGCLATINHDDDYFKYTGYTFALQFCLNEIYNRDKLLFNKMISSINKGILKNYEDVRVFWQAHQNPTEPFFKLFYSNYLKANKQSKGIESYSYVVALLVNYLENNAL